MVQYPVDTSTRNTKTQSNHSRSQAIPSASQSVNVNISVTRNTNIFPTPNVLFVANMFGLRIDENKKRIIVPPTSISLKQGELTFITGPSGSGKSSILSAIKTQLINHKNTLLIDFNDLPRLNDESLIDCLANVQVQTDTSDNEKMSPNQAKHKSNPQLSNAIRWLSLAGLNDAFVMLRSPNELSDGQHYRFKLAHMMALVHQTHAHTQSKHSHISDPPPLIVVLADEFAATLDRLTAYIIATSSRYPPIIVRPMHDLHHTQKLNENPKPQTYQILDGHHRVAALHSLKHSTAQCLVWEADDDEAFMLLATLNRLEGNDDPYKRAELVQCLVENSHHNSDTLAKLMPEKRQEIESLLALRKSLPSPRAPKSLDEIALAVHFFLLPKQRDQLNAVLKTITGERAAALMQMVTIVENTSKQAIHART